MTYGAAWYDDGPASWLAHALACSTRAENVRVHCMPTARPRQQTGFDCPKLQMERATSTGELE